MTRELVMAAGEFEYMVGCNFRSPARDVAQIQRLYVDEYWTAAEVAAHKGISASTVYRMVKAVPVEELEVNLDALERMVRKPITEAQKKKRAARKAGKKAAGRRRGRK